MEHYEAVESASEYAGVIQRWGLFRNKQSQKTEQKTLTRRMQKKSLKQWKALEKLGKTPFRCEADAMEVLLRVITLCLMIYAAIQHRIRHELKRQSRTLPDMKKKAAQNPASRWVFLCFEGIHIWTINGAEKHAVGITENQSTIMIIYILSTLRLMTFGCF